MFLGRRKNGFYYVEFFDPTQLQIRRISTGTQNKSQAKNFLSKFSFEFYQEKPNISKSLYEFKEEYLKFVGSNYSSHYLRSIKLSFSQIINFLGNIQLSEINIRILQEFFSSIYKRSPKAAELYLRTLKASFSRAVDWDYISENPFKKVKLPKSTKTFPLFITEQQLNNILLEIKQEYLKDLIIVAFYSGMRLSEIINMQWSQVDFTERYICVKNISTFTTKSKKDRIIPMCEKLYSTLINRYEKLIYKNSAIYIFERFNGVRYINDFVSKSFKKTIKQTDLNPILKFHSLRHSFASNLVQKGASLYIVKELLGHESITTTQIYSHLKRENLFEAIKLLE